ncbi:MAG: sel1 repeat family protein [Pseudomonadota bacterium]|nr:MAG: sel1 repeat family protein [Pseudomonadota bacterium]
MRKKANTICEERSTRRYLPGHATVLTLMVVLVLSLPGAVVGMGYAERTPGHKHLSAGLDAYAAGQYFSAMDKFRSAARWADKLAQFNLGVMYLNGQGSDPEPARAWAWFELAAERRYPRMVKVADQVWASLDEPGRAQARRIYDDELMPRFGDAVAVPRTASFMRRAQRSATGSRVGFRGSNMRVFEVDHARWNRTLPQDSTAIIISGRQFTGDEYYDPAHFDIYSVIAAESRLFDAEHRGDVRLGEFRLIDDEASDSEKDDNR